jgi:hypothetical protein
VEMLDDVEFETEIKATKALAKKSETKKFMQGTGETQEKLSRARATVTRPPEDFRPMVTDLPREIIKSGQNQAATEAEAESQQEE